MVLPADGDFTAMVPVNGKLGRPLSEIIGPGYAVEGVRITKTDAAPEPVTIDKAVPCLREDTPVCDLLALSREIRKTRFTLGVRSFVRQEAQ